MQRQFDVVGLGASTLDVITLVDHFPVGRDNQQAKALVLEGGGPVATAIVAAARLGARTAMIDRIGDDWAGSQVLLGFESAGVDTRLVARQADGSTSISSILVSAKNGDRAIMFQPGRADDWSLSELQRAAIRSAGFLHLNGRHFRACLEAVEVARHSGTMVSFDGGANRFRAELRDLVPLTGICIVARDFAEQYTGEVEPQASAEKLAGQGPQIAVVTDGINGSWICARDGKPMHQMAFRMPTTVDTTGCGDGYHGAFLASLAKGLSMEASATIASAVAALNSQALGGRAGLPTFAQVTEFLRARGINLG